MTVWLADDPNRISLCGDLGSMVIIALSFQQPRLTITVEHHPEFPQREDLIYLNHAAVSPWPLRTAETVKRFAEENVREGSRHYPEWLQVEQRLRERLARIINAQSADDIALLKNTSEALSVVAYGLDWRPGDNVVITNQEFPSNRIVWESLQRFGVELRAADLSHGETAEDAMMALADERTRLVAVSSVQYGTGLRMDLPRLGGFCRAHRILFCVDAIQSVGALRFDVQAMQADFVAADGHKWMLGPEGLALFYCRAELQEQPSGLQPATLGALNAAAPTCFASMRLRPACPCWRIPGWIQWKETF
jgi:cysteine desulfurase/selenocysteine lyase